MHRELLNLRQKQGSLLIHYTTCFLAVTEEQRRSASDRLDRKTYSPFCIKPSVTQSGSKLTLLSKGDVYSGQVFLKKSRNNGN